MRGCNKQEWSIVRWDFLHLVCATEILKEINFLVHRWFMRFMVGWFADRVIGGDLNGS